MAEKQVSSPWVWVFLIITLVLFAAFIVFLDQKIVRSTTQPTTNQESNSSETKPTFDFYSVLPDRKVEIPISKEYQIAIENPSINKKSQEKVILQVGSFQSAGEAESLKAQLAFLGLEATIAPAQVNQYTWHRVQIGPFSSNSMLSRTKNLLIANNIKYMQRTPAR